MSEKYVPDSVIKEATEKKLPTAAPIITGGLPQHIAAQMITEGMVKGNQEAHVVKTVQTAYQTGESVDGRGFAIESTSIPVGDDKDLTRKENLWPSVKEK